MKIYRFLWLLLLAVSSFAHDLLSSLYFFAVEFVPRPKQTLAVFCIWLTCLSAFGQTHTEITAEDAQTISGAKTFSNNNFLKWLKSDGVTPITVIGLDNTNNVTIGDTAGSGIFFKIGGTGVGDVSAPSSGNFAGSLGWNNMVINPASFGINPSIDNPSWNASAFPFGETDATLNNNAFVATFHMKMNSSATNTGNIEKGGAFFRCVDNDTTSTVPPNCVGLDALAEGPTANSNSQLWGGVMRFQVDAGGDGSGKGLEIDSTNNATNVNAHGDAGLKTKTGLWFFATGSAPSSWMIDSATGGIGWDNGIAVRNIAAGGIGFQLPNNIGLYWRNAANNADLKVLNIDASNNLVLNSASAGGLFFQVNGSTVGSNDGTGWANMTIKSPTYQNANLLISPTAPTIAGAGCGGSAASIPNNNGTAAFTVNVGTAPTTACTVTLPTAATGWNCFATDITTNSTTVFLQKQSGGSTTTAVITNYNDVAVAANFTASDVVRMSCFAY